MAKKKYEDMSYSDFRRAIRAVWKEDDAADVGLMTLCRRIKDATGYPHGDMIVNRMESAHFGSFSCLLEVVLRASDGEIFTVRDTYRLTP